MRCVRLTALVLALLLPLAGARAFEPQGISELSLAYGEGRSLRLDVTGELAEWKELSKGSVQALADWLRDTALELEVSKDTYALRLTRQGEELLSLSEGAYEGGRLLALDSAGLGFLTDAELDPLALLLGKEQEGIGPTIRLIDFSWLRDLPETALSLIEPYGKDVKRSATVKNVGTSVRRIEYELAPEEWSRVWPLLKEALYRAAAGLPAEASEALEDLRFDKAVTLKRLFDKQDEPLGWQMNATVLLPSGVSRKLSFSGGFAKGKGLYLSLKAPAARGKDDLSLALSSAEDDKNLSADWALSSRVDTERYSLKGAVRLKLSVTEAGERLSGKLWSEEKRGSDSARRLTLEPDLNFSGARLKGKIRVMEELAGKTRLNLSLSVTAAEGEGPGLQVPERVMDLKADLAGAQSALTQALLPLVKGFLMDIPEDRRLLVLHDMGRTARTEGATVPVLDETPEYVVIEDAYKEVTP